MQTLILPLVNYNYVEFMFFEYKHQSVVSGPQSQDVLLRLQGCYILHRAVPLHPLLGLEIDKDMVATVAQCRKLHAGRTDCELLVLPGCLDVGQSIEGSSVLPANERFVWAITGGWSHFWLPENGVYIVLETDEGWGLRERG